MVLSPCFPNFYSMKKIKYILVLLLCFVITASYAQTKISNADTTVAFKVSGACEQCKHRIENAIKIKGVTSGIWDVDSKMLTLVYNPSKVTLQKIQIIYDEAYNMLIMQPVCNYCWKYAYNNNYWKPPL